MLCFVIVSIIHVIIVVYGVGVTVMTVVNVVVVTRITGVYCVTDIASSRCGVVMCDVDVVGYAVVGGVADVVVRM